MFSIYHPNGIMGLGVFVIKYFRHFTTPQPDRSSAATDSACRSYHNTNSRRCTYIQKSARIYVNYACLRSIQIFSSSRSVVENCIHELFWFVLLRARTMFVCLCVCAPHSTFRTTQSIQRSRTTINNIVGKCRAWAVCEYETIVFIVDLESWFRYSSMRI